MGVRLTASTYYFKPSVLTSTNYTKVSGSKSTKFKMVGTHS